ncbi:MAG TPA: hypothetical protein PLZ31_11970 [Myxococcota bacterium]|nr:hypothetical protein [Myxococcota bacterium]
MKKLIVSSALLLIAAFVPTGLTALAEDLEGVPPEEVTLGELTIKFSNVEFPSVRVDGEAWEDSEYSVDGRKVAIQRLDRTVEHVISLVSNSPKAGDTELVVKPEDWKLVKLNKLDRAWRCEKTAAFPKKAPPPKVETPTDEEGEPAAEPAAEPVP